MVHDLVVAADLRVLVGQRVEAVRAGRDDLLVRADRVERLDVLHGLHLEQELVAEPAGRVAGAGLAGAEDRELDARRRAAARRTARVVFLDRSSSAPAQPTQNRYSTSSGIGSPGSTRRTSKSRPSVHSSRARSLSAPRVALVLEVAQHHAGLGRERRLDQHLVAAHVDDVVDVLDVDRALLDAGAAGGARPQHVRVDDAALLGGADQRALAPGPRRSSGTRPKPDSGTPPGRLPASAASAAAAASTPSGVAGDVRAVRAGRAPWRTGGRAGP